jgi:predicted phage-related endonuclease
MERICHDDLIQGSDAWHQFRMIHRGASEAYRMLGIPGPKNRNSLLHEKKTGIAEDVDEWTQKNVFDKGHRLEAMARPIVDEIVGDVLYPVTYSYGKLSASCDGLTMNRRVAFEHKQANVTYVEMVRNGVVPEEHMPQCQQVLLVTGAEKLIFVISDGTRENMEYVWVYPDAEYQARIVAGWDQFERDLEAYVPQESTAPVAAAPVETLPSVFVQVTGKLAVTDNLQKFGEALKTFIDRINTQPKTDDDFAVCESAVKTLSKAEEALDAAESSALAQVACIDEMRMLKATLKDLARSNRLALEKLVKTEKESRKLAIVQKGQQTLAARIALFEEAEYMPQITGDFGGAVKGLKTITSMKNAVDTELARVTIEAVTIREKIRANLAAINAEPEYQSLFADLRSLVLKDADFVALTVQQRIADHKAAIAKREEETRARIQADADAKAKALAATPAPVEPVVFAADAISRSVEAAIQSDNGATMTLGQISTRLGFGVTKDSLASLGFAGRRDKAAMLYRECDFAAICSAIIRHVQVVAGEMRKAA